MGGPGLDWLRCADAWSVLLHRDSHSKRTMTVIQVLRRRRRSSLAAATVPAFILRRPDARRTARMHGQHATRRDRSAGHGEAGTACVVGLRRGVAARRRENRFPLAKLAISVSTALSSARPKVRGAQPGASRPRSLAGDRGPGASWDHSSFITLHWAVQGAMPNSDYTGRERALRNLVQNLELRILFLRGGFWRH